MAIVSVIGATGRQGLAQVKYLLEAGYQVRALSRNSKPALEGMASQVDVQFINMEDASSIAPAVAGSDYVFYNQPLHLNARRVELVEYVGRACFEANVKHLIWNTSSWIPDRPGDPFTFVHNTKGVNSLWAIGVPATVFGSVIFMDNLLTDWARPNLINAQRYSYPHAPNVNANWISLDDVAKVMVASLKRPDMIGSWMNLGGPERFNGEGVTKVLAKVLGYNIEYAPYTPEEFAESLSGALGEALSGPQKDAFETYISNFYHYCNTASTRPFEVNAEHIAERFPEVQFEKLYDWALRQDWSDSANRPSGG